MSLLYSESWNYRDPKLIRESLTTKHIRPTTATGSDNKKDEAKKVLCFSDILLILKSI